jgi:spermidine synthase
LQRFGLLLVGVIFLFSGAFALIYEVTWARMLAREFGSDAVAIAIVVAVFMLGLGLGARLAGVWGDRLQNPLKVYGYLEAGLSVYVLASVWLISLFTPLLGLLGHGAIENVWILNSARTALGMLVLLPPTLLMGASLPLLVRFVADVARHVPSAVIGLYTINIVGAVFGVLAAGFWLLPTMGMSQVLVIVALANLVMAGLVLAMSRHYEQSHLARQSVSETSSAEPGKPDWILPLAVLIAGLASMACQLAWTRVIVLIVGGSAYAFSTVLAVFLAGMGLGAWLVTLGLRFGGDRAHGLFLFAAVASVVTIFVSTLVLPTLPGLFLDWFDPGQAGSRFGLMGLQLGVTAVLFLLPAVFMGMLFPLILRIGLGDLSRPAHDTGRLYLANTAGCVIGALLAGLVLIPTVGLLPTLLIAIGLICYSLLLVYSTIRGTRPQLLLALVLMLAYGAGWYLVPPWNAQLMAAGLSEYARTFQQIEIQDLSENLARRSELLYYRDGRTATITVLQDRVTATRDLYIATNGKIDGSSHSDMPTQKLSAHLPLLLHDSPREVAVIGLGTGVTSGSSTVHAGVERVVTVEIEPAMVEGARYFTAFNHGIHEHPRSDIRITDGRLHLFLARDHYDVIISEPSNPWIAGTASLFTREFYQLGARALRDGGIFTQWIQVYNMEPDNIRSVIRTFQSVFPHTYGAVTLIGSDLVLIGSQTPIDINPRQIAARMRQPAVRADLADPAVGINTVWELLARIWLAPGDLAALAGEVRLHKDDWPFLMYEAPLSRYLEVSDSNMFMISNAGGGLVEHLIGQGLTGDEAAALLGAYLNYVPERFRQLPAEP